MGPRAQNKKSKYGTQCVCALILHTLQSEIQHPSWLLSAPLRGILSKICILSQQRSNIFHIILTIKAAICPHSTDRLAFLINLRCVIGETELEFFGRISRWFKQVFWLSADTPVKCKKSTSVTLRPTPSTSVQLIYDDSYSNAIRATTPIRQGSHRVSVVWQPSSVATVAAAVWRSASWRWTHTGETLLESLHKQFYHYIGANTLHWPCSELRQRV